MADVTLNDTQLFQTRFINYTKACFLAVLQAAFGYSGTPDAYKWTEDQATSKIGIWKTWPDRVLKPNTITVEVTGGTRNIGYIGDDEFINELPDPATGPITDLEFQGEIKLSVNLHVRTARAVDCELLTDILMIYVTHLFRHKLAVLGIAYIEVRAGGEGVEIIDNEKYFSNTVTVEARNEYRQKIPIALLDIIDKVQVDVQPVMTL